MRVVVVRRLYRSRAHCKIAGVCGGLGEHFNVDPNLFRVGFILLAFYGGTGVLLYLVSWLLIPPGGEPFHSGPEANETPADRVETAARQVADVVEGRIRAWDPGSEKGTRVLGLLLVFVGAILILNNFNAFTFDLFDYLNWRKLWPTVLIAAGALLLWGQLRKA